MLGRKGRERKVGSVNTRDKTKKIRALFPRCEPEFRYKFENTHLSGDAKWGNSFV